MKTFKEAYGVLSRHAQTLRNQQEPNIDDLLTIVTESVEAYKVCKQRIDAVEAALGKALGDPDVAPETATAESPPDDGAVQQVKQNAAAKSSTGFEDMDDDIPF
jgi:exodeoxyribonuclease VII small subunit